MDTSAIAVLLYYILCLVLALTVVALTILYKMKLPSSKGVRDLKREGGQLEESAREAKTENRPALNSSFGHGIHKQAISSSEKTLKPEPAANEIRKQVQSKNTAPVKSSESTVDLKDDSVSHIPLSSASQRQSAINEPKSGEKPPHEPSASEQIEHTEVQEQSQTNDTAQIRRLQPKGPIKAYSGSQYTTITDLPKKQLAKTESKNGEEPSHESSSVNTSPAGEKNDPVHIAEPAQIEKESEASMNTKPGTDVNEANSKPPAATTVSGETGQEMPQKQKSGLGDLADLFATSASEFTEKNRLAEEVNDVDVNELLQEGLGLLGKVKKSDG